MSHLTDYSRALAMDISCIAFGVIVRWATGLLTEIESTVLKVLWKTLSERSSNALLKLFMRAKLAQSLNRHLLKCESNYFNGGCKHIFFLLGGWVFLYLIITRTLKKQDWTGMIETLKKYIHKCGWGVESNLLLYFTVFIHLILL